MLNPKFCRQYFVPGIWWISKDFFVIFVLYTIQPVIVNNSISVVYQLTELAVHVFLDSPRAVQPKLSYYSSCLIYFCLMTCNGLSIAPLNCCSQIFRIASQVISAKNFLTVVGKTIKERSNIINIPLIHKASCVKWCNWIFLNTYMTTEHTFDEEHLHDAWGTTHKFCKMPTLQLNYRSMKRYHQTGEAEIKWKWIRLTFFPTCACGGVRECVLCISLIRRRLTRET